MPAATPPLGNFAEAWPAVERPDLLAGPVAAALGSPGLAVVGTGLRRSKLLVPGKVLGALPGARVVEGLTG